MNTLLAIDATELSAGYRHIGVLQQVSLKIPAGRWTSIVGPNGAGKSTLLSILAGLLPHQGQVRYPSRPKQGRVSSRQQAQHLAWLGQYTTGADDLTVCDLVLLGRLPHRAWWASLTSEDHAAVEHALNTVGAWHWRHRRVGDLSGGERQRVLLARALAVQAPLLLMDEPLASLDPPHQVEWLHWMRALLAQGTTIVSVLHEISMALQADDLVVLDQGQLVHHGSSCHPDTHAAVEKVFQHSIRICTVDGQWVALPCVGVQAVTHDFGSLSKIQSGF